MHILSYLNRSLFKRRKYCKTSPVLPGIFVYSLSCWIPKLSVFLVSQYVTCMKGTTRIPSIRLPTKHGKTDRHLSTHAPHGSDVPLGASLKGVAHAHGDLPTRQELIDPYLVTSSGTFASLLVWRFRYLPARQKQMNHIQSHDRPACQPENPRYWKMMSAA